ncbi:unnamed protein product [Cyprideis torosa]|uniref:Uncharacterized protein n=1 Tax=Cyprideis torosa TaxID=163714 RepID=A0A7R8W7C6_9CRUS|nr:unnamed protein product [Cyprideis torosa]CAG0882287.1 unnamed protein product [Cyprideis torosa]
MGTVTADTIFVEGVYRLTYLVTFCSLAKQYQGILKEDWAGHAQPQVAVWRVTRRTDGRRDEERADSFFWAGSVRHSTGADGDMVPPGLGIGALFLFLETSGGARDWGAGETAQEMLQQDSQQVQKDRLLRRFSTQSRSQSQLSAQDVVKASVRQGLCVLRCFEQYLPSSSMDNVVKSCDNHWNCFMVGSCQGGCSFYEAIIKAGIGGLNDTAYELPSAPVLTRDRRLVWLPPAAKSKALMEPRVSGREKQWVIYLVSLKGSSGKWAMVERTTATSTTLRIKDDSFEGETEALLVAINSTGLMAWSQGTVAFPMKIPPLLPDSNAPKILEEEFTEALLSMQSDASVSPENSPLEVLDPFDLRVVRMKAVTNGFPWLHVLLAWSWPKSHPQPDFYQIAWEHEKPQKSSTNKSLMVTDESATIPLKRDEVYIIRLEAKYRLPLAQPRVYRAELRLDTSAWKESQMTNGTSDFMNACIMIISGLLGVALILFLVGLAIKRSRQLYNSPSKNIAVAESDIDSVASSSSSDPASPSSSARIVDPTSDRHQP